MNIFYLDKNVKQCAEWHNNKHCVRMVLESAQLLSTAHRVLDGRIEIVNGKKKYVLYDISQGDGIQVSPKDEILYKATHINHPSAVWTRQSPDNYAYVYNLFCALLEEYTYRYGKVHKSSKLVIPLQDYPKNIHRNQSWSEPPQCMPDDCKVGGDSIAAYKNYYRTHKARMAEWKNRPVPDWYVSN